MRIRTVKPEFWASLTLDKLSYPERLTFIGLWNYADDEGRGLADARLIKAAIWPLDGRITAKSVDQMLTAMAELQLLVLYESGGRRYYSVQNWLEHQAISRPRPSRLPEPSVNGYGALHAGKERNREQGKEQGTGNMMAPIPAREDQAIFEAVADGCKIDWRDGLTKSARGEINAAVGQLLAEDAGHIEPDEIRRRAANWPTLFENATLTPSALVKWWGQLATATPRHSRSTATGMALIAEAEAEGR